MDVALVVVSGRRKGRVIEIDSPQFRIGRDSCCHFQPEGVLVAGMHSVITVDDDTVTIEDCGKTFGTRVNDEAIHLRRRLKHGDRITIANLELEVRFGGDWEEESDEWLAEVMEESAQSTSKAIKPIQGTLAKEETGSVLFATETSPPFTPAREYARALKKRVTRAKELAWENTDKLLVAATVSLCILTGLSLYEPTAVIMSKAGDAVWKGIWIVLNVPKWQWWGWSLLCLTALVISVFVKASQET